MGHQQTVLMATTCGLPLNSNLFCSVLARLYETNPKVIKNIGFEVTRVLVLAVLNS
jgi:hypothetical protein